MLLKDLKKTTQSRRTAFLGALVLIGLIAIYNWIVTPHRNFLMAAQRYESALDNLAQRNQTLDNNLTVKKKELEKLHDQLNFKLDMFFDSAAAGAFFSGIKAVTEKAGCILCSLTFSSTDSTSGTNLQGVNSYITAHEAQLSVLGGYGDIESLMNKGLSREEAIKQLAVKEKIIK